MACHRQAVPHSALLLGGGRGCFTPLCAPVALDGFMAEATQPWISSWLLRLPLSMLCPQMGPATALFPSTNPRSDIMAQPESQILFGPLDNTLFGATGGAAAVQDPGTL